MMWLILLALLAPVVLVVLVVSIAVVLRLVVPAEVEVEGAQEKLGMEKEGVGGRDVGCADLLGSRAGWWGRVGWGRGLLD